MWGGQPKELVLDILSSDGYCHCRAFFCRARASAGLWHYMLEPRREFSLGPLLLLFLFFFLITK